MSLEHADFLLPASKVSKFSSGYFLTLEVRACTETPIYLSPHGNYSLGQKDKDCAHELFKHCFEAHDMSNGALERLSPERRSGDCV